MHVAGFDLGANFGYAVLTVDGSDIVESGTWNLGKRCPASLSTLERNLQDMFSRYVLIGVGYEKVHMFQRGFKAAHAYGGYEAVLWIVSHTHSVVDLSQIAIQTIKKTATGSGRADKEEVEAAVLERWAHMPDDDNESDAIWCAETVRQNHVSSL